MNKQKKIIAENNEVFHFMGMSFDIDKAEKILKNRKTEKIKPSQGLIGFIHVDKKHAESADLEKPLILATLMFDGKEGNMLIDGHHRVYKALHIDKKDKLPAQVLTFEETMDIMKGPQKK